MQRNRGKHRKENTRDIFKKIRDIKGTFHSKINTIIDRKSKDLREAEEIKLPLRSGGSFYPKETYRTFAAGPVILWQRQT